MKAGAENRKKTITAGALGAVALVCLFVLYNTLFGGDTPPPPSIAPVRTTAEQVAPSSNAKTAAGTKAMPSGATPGVDAQKMAKASSSLDPTLDETAMLRTENLVYSGAGRNIFSLVYEAPAPPVVIRKPPPARTNPVVLPPVPPQPPPTCPPSCPPIPLKFFGTATRSSGLRQAFLLQGEDVYMAGPGDIVARKYKIVDVGTNSIRVEDLTNHYTQSLPLQQ